MAFLYGTLKRLNFFTVPRPLISRKATISQWPQNFHTSRKWQSLQQNGSPASESHSTFAEAENAVKERRPRKSSGSRRWSEADKALLLQMRMEEQPADVIAEKLGRNVQAIHRAWSRRVRFSAAEDEQILKAQRDGLSWRELRAQMPLHSLIQIKRRHWCLDSGRTTETPAPKQAFSLQEDEQIIDFRKQRMEWPEMSKLMPGRDPSSLRRRYKLIVPEAERVKVTIKSWWTDEETKRLRHMTETGLSVAQIASELGKTRSSVYLKLRRIRFSDRADTSNKRWGEIEDELIQKLAASRTPILEIAKSIGRTQDAVEHRLGRLKRLEQPIGIKSR